MNDIALSKPSLWREGLRSFRRDWEPWRKSVFWFFIALVPLCYLMLSESADSQKVFVDLMRQEIHQAKHGVETIKAHKEPVHEIVKPAPKQSAESKGHLLTSYVVQFLVAIVTWIFTYLLFGFCARHENIVKDARQNWKGFFYFLWNLVKVFFVTFLLVIAACFAVVLACGVLYFLLALLHIPKIPITVVMVIAVFAAYVFLLGVMFYIATRFSLVGALAALRVQSTLEISSDLTRNNICRIIWSGIVLTVIMLPLLVFSSGIMVGYGFLASDNAPAAVLFSVIYAASLVLMIGIDTAFRTVTLRILCQEAKQADPAFQLRL